MKHTLIFTALGIGLLLGSGCQKRYSDEDNRYQRESPGHAYEADAAWRGPGWYYGIWFTNKGAYNAWRSRRSYQTTRPRAYYYFERPAYRRYSTWTWRWRRDRREWREDRRERGRRDREAIRRPRGRRNP